jgi:hypothetical protein
LVAQGLEGRGQLEVPAHGRARAYAAESAVAPPVPTCIIGSARRGPIGTKVRTRPTGAG